MGHGVKMNKLASIFEGILLKTEFIRVVENLESHGIL